MPSTTLKKILYVEDEPDIRTIARIALETVGKLEVKVCASGQEALNEVAAFSPDCILLDVMMPGMDGPTTLAALRKLPGCAAIPAIFMTAKVQPAEVEQYKRLGAVGVIPKPFDPLKLAAKVKELLENPS